MTRTKPRVFVSSTTEFHDLRSALKFWLEEGGFEVLAFEFADFEHRPDDSAFEACFSNVRESDYYLLLIGRLQGSRYDETATVTQQEYRVAYEGFRRTGTPKVICLIRSDVTQGIRDLRAVGNLEANGDLAFADAFIREVRREGDGNQPGSLTVPFTSFKDLAEGLRATIPALRIPIARHAALGALRHELEYNLRALVQKVKGRPLFGTWILKEVQEQVVLTREDIRDIARSIELNHQELKLIVMYINGGLPAADELVDATLRSVIASGSLLDWNATDGRYDDTALSERVLDLQEQLATFRRRAASLDDDFHTRLLERWRDSRAHPESKVRVRVDDVLRLFGTCDAQANVERVMLSILLHIYQGVELPPVELRHSSPIPAEREAVDQEVVTREELRAWLRSDEVLLRTALHDASAEDKRQGRALWTDIESALGKDRADQILRSGRVDHKLSDTELASLVRVLTKHGYL